MEKPSFPPGFWADLAEENPLGVALSAQDTKEWFDWAWFRYKTYDYRNHKRAVRRWWSGVTQADLDRSRERARNLRSADTAQAIAADPAPSPPDLFSRLH